MASQKLIVLVTGGNQGLGYYAVQQLSALGKYHVLMGSRDLSKAAKAIESIKSDSSQPSDANNVEAIQIDVTSDDSIAQAVQTVQKKYGRLDILMNNAGIASVAGAEDDGVANADESGPSLREQYRQMYDANVFGVGVVTEAFLPLLRKSSQPGGKRIAFTGSGIASLRYTADAGAAAKMWRIYRTTKTAMTMLMLSYAGELAEEGFVVSASNPGFCSTNLNDFSGLKDPRDGAKVLVHAAIGPKEDVHGVVVDLELGGPVPW